MDIKRQRKQRDYTTKKAQNDLDMPSPKVAAFSVLFPIFASFVFLFLNAVFKAAMDYGRLLPIIQAFCPLYRVLTGRK